MGHWHVTRNPTSNKRQLTYRDIVHEQSTDCGEAEEWTTENAIVDWIVHYGDGSPGDFIFFHDTGHALSLKGFGAQA